MKISVVIPAYNIESHIGASIDSVLAQTCLPDEIIVVDDGSTDTTSEKIKCYGNKVRYIHQNNRGLSGARNTGIRQAKYEWIAFLDGDDEWLPNHLKLQCELLCRNPELSWIGGNFLNCDCQRGHRQSPRLNARQRADAQRKMTTPDFFEDYFTAYKVMASGHPNTMMIRREVLFQVGLFYEGSPMFEDLDMWFRLAYLDLKYGYVFEPIAIYHLSVQGSLTQRYKEFEYVDDYIQRHLELSRKAGKLEQFQQCARGSLSYRARFLMANGKGKQVRRLLDKYGDYLAPSFRASCYIGSFCPLLWNAKENTKKRIRLILKLLKNGK